MTADEAPAWGTIRVRGAGENNLRDVDVDLPKRELTVFTGVSGSGKSSLVFETIAAESRRLINETYSAFLQGFMATPARPDVESLSGLTAATIDIDALVDRDRSLNEGAITFPNFQPGGWYHRIFVDSGFFDPDKKLRDYTEAEWQRLLHGPEAKVKTELVTLTYEGLVDKIRSRYLVKDTESLPPSLRTAVERIATFTACPSCHGTRLNALARSSLIEGRSIAD